MFLFRQVFSMFPRMIAEIFVSSVCFVSFPHHSDSTSQFFCLLDSGKFWKKKKQQPKDKQAKEDKNPNKTKFQTQVKICCPDLLLSFAVIVPATSPSFRWCSAWPSSALPAVLFLPFLWQHLWRQDTTFPALEITLSWLCLRAGWRLVSCAHDSHIACSNFTPINNPFDYLKQISLKQAGGPILKSINTQLLDDSLSGLSNPHFARQPVKLQVKNF